MITFCLRLSSWFVWLLCSLFLLSCPSTTKTHWRVSAQLSWRQPWALVSWGIVLTLGVGGSRMNNPSPKTARVVLFPKITLSVMPRAHKTSSPRPHYKLSGVRAYRKNRRWWFNTVDRDVWVKEGDPGLTYQVDDVRYYRPFDGIFDMELETGKRKRKPGAGWQSVKNITINLETMDLILSLLIAG